MASGSHYLTSELAYRLFGPEIPLTKAASEAVALLPDLPTAMNKSC